MRWIGVLCALVLGCSFRSPPGGLPSDADPGVDSVDAPGEAPPVDGPPAAVTRTRRIDITDAQVTGGPHTDFPLLVSITAPWLRATSSGGDVASPNGFDIGFFADAAGATRLDHEVELYAADTGTLVAWVKVPMLSSASELFLRYGDPAIATSQESIAAVWSNGFAAVWHLHGGVADSTANNNAGTNGGTAAVGGRIAEGRSFDGVNDVVTLGSGTSIDDVFAGGGGTAEAWFRATSWGGGQFGRIIEKGDTTGLDASGWSFAVDNQNVTGSILFLHVTTAQVGHWNAPQNSVALNAWTHVAVVYNQGSTANNPSIYINGASVTVSELSQPTGSLIADAPDLGRIGNRGGGDRAFDGRVDEVRLSRTVRSAGWIATSHRNQSDPDAFYTVGPEQ